MLDWDDLRTFLAISRYGTLSAASRALGVQQSTMGRRLTAMEERVGARLLTKTPRGYVLTPAGEAVLGNVERMEGEALAAERLITGQDVRLEGRIRLTCVESLAVTILSPVLAAFHAQYPGISVDVITDVRALNLARREADVALRFAPPSQGDVAVRKVAQTATGVYASPEYLTRRGIPDFAAGTPGHSIIQTDEDLLELPEMAWFSGLMRDANVALRSNSRLLHVAAAEAGLGMACLMRYLGDASMRLQRVPTPSVPPTRTLWLVVHNDIRHMPRIRALTDFLTQGLKKSAPVLDPPPDPIL